MNNHTAKGYDAAVSQREDDVLDRWRIATEIVEVIETTPSEWSARIGIFAGWGEGKSTVLRFAEKMLQKEGDVVFWFSPWAIQHWNDLWEEFGNSFSEALAAADIPFDGSWKKRAKDSGKWLESKGVGDMTEAAATIVGGDKIYSAAFGLLSRWLKYDGAQILSIREKLGQRRLVVMIDDLDRCSPELIPRLLLSLRELLDLPGFTFLLAFDDEIVGRALADHNPAWIDGAAFLEKILDFRFHLPPITAQQKERFVATAISKYCPFVPISSAQKIQDLLPDNPRNLKALIRSLAALKPQIERHDSDELNWVDMWLAQMLRLESYPFLERLLKEDKLEAEAGIQYRILSNFKGITGGIEEEKKRLEQLIKEIGIKDEGKIIRISRLIEAARSRSSMKFKYICELAMRPHAVTWKEFRLFHESWKATPTPATMENWIKEHAAERGVDEPDVEAELFDSILGKRSEYLAAAAESESIEEHEEQALHADNLITMLSQFVIDLRKLTGQRFSKIADQVFYWIGFRTNSADKRLRGHEEELLLRLSTASQKELSTELVEVLKPWERQWWKELGDDNIEQKMTLREKCAANLLPTVTADALGYLSKDGGIREIAEPGRFGAFKYCLFHSESPIWRTCLALRLYETIQMGLKDAVIYRNVHELLDLLIKGHQEGIDFISRGEISKLFSNHTLLALIWKTSTSREIQFRMQVRLIRARDFLILNGVPEAELPLTPGLQTRVDSEKAERQLTQEPAI